MEDAKLLPVPNTSGASASIADVLLVLDNGKAILCHSQILSMHSAVLCNMFADLGAGQHNERVTVPLADFTEAQCLALLTYLYSQDTSTKGAAFEEHNAADLEAAVAVARFAHTYHVLHALRHVEAYLTAFMRERFQSGHGSAGMAGKTCDKTVLEWAVMADKFGMHELGSQGEQAMVMNWECFRYRPDLVDRLSSRVLQRIKRVLYSKLWSTRHHSMVDFA